MDGALTVTRASAAMVIVALVAVGGTLLVESSSNLGIQGDVETQRVAVDLADRGLKAIRKARLERGHDFDRQLDPADSGMIGDASSPCTSLTGHLESKQTTINPNFAAVAVELLQRAGVGEGDLVAVGCTGSLPALNTALYMAIEALGAKPIIVHSAASSQYGANHPDMMWLDMEQVLRDEELISFRTGVATLGGEGDHAHGMSNESQSVLAASLQRNGVAQMKVEELSHSIDARMSYYDVLANGKKVRAYVNVGGGVASINGETGSEMFGNGLTKTLPKNATEIDCVATRFAKRGVPVVNLNNGILLAKSFGLPIAPQQMPTAGTGDMLNSSRPYHVVVGLLLVGALAVARVYV
ncbi:poly-gamma-glutamate system protein [Aeoliella sp. SH292]|uniref:poly-gamma-glutamate system protein n=1 Tax=Aeoliella sp. SH292 TaxID=3454464 RepID=UPI003F9C770D